MIQYIAAILPKTAVSNTSKAVIRMSLTAAIIWSQRGLTELKISAIRRLIFLEWNQTRIYKIIFI